MKIWSTGTVHGWDMDGESFRWPYVECYEQPLWRYAYGRLFHRTLCKAMCNRFLCLCRPLGGWPDIRCYEANYGGRITRFMFEDRGAGDEQWHARKSTHYPERSRDDER